MRTSSCLLLILCTSWLLLPSAGKGQVFDDFEEDPRDDPAWELYEPAAAGEYLTDDSYFRVTIPAGINLDTWTGVDNGIQLRRTDFPDDFVVETRIRMVGSGDPDQAIFPPLVENYLANLMIQFSQFDLIHFGPQMGYQTIRNQRTGNTFPPCDTISDFDEFSLRIAKRGTNYTSSWRPTDEDEWILVCERVVEEPPVSVGLIFKTWANLTDRQTYSFDYFRIAENPSPSIEDVVPANGEQFHDASQGLSFLTRSGPGGGEIDQITLILNDVDVSAELDVSGPANERSVLYDGLASDTLYSASIEVVDTDGNPSGLSFEFGTFPVDGGGEFEDEFDDDPTENGWEWYEPLTPVASFVDDGRLFITLPVGLNMDHWVTADRATILRRSGLPQDFEMETRVRIEGSGDPLQPVFPPVAENYLANLTIQFSQFDLIHFGFQRGTSVRVQRTGNTIAACDLANDVDELSFGVVKLGNEYTFRYRISDDDPWTTLCTRSLLGTPIYGGLLFKTWQALSTEQTFSFDYFRILEIAPDPPTLSSCADEVAWVGQPFRFPIELGGVPRPSVSVAAGPAGLEYDEESGHLVGWTPSETGEVTIEVEATNDAGTETSELQISVRDPQSAPDEPFDSDPAANPDWELYEPQPGVQYSIVDDGGENWWRLDVPLAGEFGAPFDTWIGVDNAPQLRQPAPTEDFVMQTRVRIDPLTAPIPTAEFLAGLMINFGGSDVLHWNLGQERSIRFETKNLFLERSGQGNIGHGLVEGMIDGNAVDLRIERRCDDYNCYYRPAGAGDWIYSATHTTSDEPVFIGLIMKTWGNGTEFSAEFDSFDDLSTDDGPPPPPPPTDRFLRGDADASGAINITDGIFILNFLFLGGGDPSCRKAADVDDSGAVNITDGIYVLNFLFLGGGAPPSPHPECGSDDSEELDCAESHPCA
ncbi:MAG: dockerin type I repeat-containing protein [Planctomycetota bacterium]